MHDPWTEEYDAAAYWCAKRGLSGELGTPLPAMMSTKCFDAIDADPEAFVRRVKESAYMVAMMQRNFSDD